MRIALAQINSTIGDFDGNTQRIVEYARLARARGADICIFPEQTIPGYPAHDLLERDLFIAQNVNALNTLATLVKDIALVVGFAEPNDLPVGKRLFNAAAFIADGQVVSIHRKTLLPTYDVFDESRYFAPSPYTEVGIYKGIRFGITICEDIWNAPEFWARYDPNHRYYDHDPGLELVRQGAQFIVNIAASPFTIEKRSLRRQMLQAEAKRFKTPLLFVNSVGGNDELIFDGASLVFSANGQIWAQGVEFAEDLLLVDLDTGEGDVHPVLNSDDKAALAALILGTRDYACKCCFKSAILGLSGGIDSALTLVVGARALGAENIEAVMMPSRYSSRGAIDDSLALARNLGVKTRIINIDNLFDKYLSEITPHFDRLPSDTTEENFQARIRGNILMALSNKFGHLVLSTGNKSELATGYCTLYGDMAGGLAVLADVPKTMVYRLARLINREREIIPPAILAKAPSAELKPDQCDQDTLPSYELLDEIIFNYIDKGKDTPELIKAGFDKNVVAQVMQLIRSSEYKRRQAPPGLKIMSKSFGYGRRVPLAYKWKS